MATKSGYRAGFVTLIDVNIVLPLVAVILAILYPRIRAALLGALLMAGMFALGPRLLRVPNVFRWSPGPVAATISPILVLACIGYAVIGIITVLLVRPWRQVGIPESPVHCRACGYLIVHLNQPRCPECGAAFDAARVREAQSQSDIPGARSHPPGS